MLISKKLPGPSDTGDRRRDVLEKLALMIDTPSETIVPVPTELR
jgi:hypothetical protein